MNSNNVFHKDVTENATSCENSMSGELTPITLNYRPRGSLARTLYEKQQNDYYLTHLDKMQVSIQYIAVFISFVSGKQLKLPGVYVYKLGHKRMRLVQITAAKRR